MSNRMAEPNFFVVGAAKSGTTSLYYYLKQHPEVYMSPIKETNFFSTDIDPDNFSRLYKKLYKSKKLDLEKYTSSSMDKLVWGAYVREWEHYVRLFQSAQNEKAIGEVSNSYLYSKVAASNIYNNFPNAKIVMILRNPVQRAFSHYLANIRDGKARRSLIEEIELDNNRRKKGWGVSALYIELGMYYEQVKRYLDLFPRKNVRIILYDEYMKNTSMVMEDLFSFLNISRNVKIDFTKRYNAARIPKNKNVIYLVTQMNLKRAVFHLIPEAYKKRVKDLFFSRVEKPELEKNEKDFLIRIYKEDITKLERLIQYDLSVWKN